MEFKDTAVVSKLFATVISSCCRSRLYFSGTDSVYAIYSLGIHYYSTRKSWEDRRKNTSQSNCNNYLSCLKSFHLFYMRKTKPTKKNKTSVMQFMHVMWLSDFMLETEHDIIHFNIDV